MEKSALNFFSSQRRQGCARVNRFCNSSIRFLLDRLKAQIPWNWIITCNHWLQKLNKEIITCWPPEGLKSLRKESRKRGQSFVEFHIVRGIRIVS